MAWLREHPDHLIGVPGLGEDVTDAGDVALTRLHAAMRAAQLFGATAISAQRDVIRRLVSDLRSAA